MKDYDTVKKLQSLESGLHRFSSAGQLLITYGVSHIVVLPLLESVNPGPGLR